jgi:hypothetical protein
VRRRDFIEAIVGSSAAWSLAARAQQPSKLPVIGLPPYPPVVGGGGWRTESALPSQVAFEYPIIFWTSSEV